MSKNKTVYKYPLHIEKPVTLELSGDVVLMAPQGPGAGLNLQLFIWAEYGVQKPRWRTFEVFGTGHTVPEDAVHIGSVVTDPFVWHVYETFPAQGGEQ